MTARIRAGAVLAAALPLMAGMVLAQAVPAAAKTTGWELEALDAVKAQGVSTGRGVVVAVVDTGVGRHPDLDGHVLDGRSFIDGDPRRDQDGHGSDMAWHILSVAPDAKILPVQVAAGGDDFTFAPAVAGIRWAVDNGAQVVNISLAGHVATDEEIEAIGYALDHGVPVIAGTGNDPGGKVASPAYLPGVVAVSGYSRSGEIWAKSTTGPETVLSAPAEDIPGITVDGPGTDAGYTTGTSGTSIATALTSGAAALIRAKYPDLKAPDVINRLVATAKDAGAPGRDDQYGYGKVDAYAAVTADVPPVGANPLGDPASALSATGAGDARAHGSPLPVVLAAAGGAVVLAAAVVVIVVASRRRRRRPPPPGPYAYPPPPPPAQR